MKEGVSGEPRPKLEKNSSFNEGLQSGNGKNGAFKCIAIGPDGDWGTLKWITENFHGESAVRTDLGKAGGEKEVEGLRQRGEKERSFLRPDRKKLRTGWEVKKQRGRGQKSKHMQRIGAGALPSRKEKVRTRKGKKREKK